MNKDAERRASSGSAADGGSMSKFNLDVLAYEESPVGMICLRRRELLSEPGTVVTEITLDHEFLMSSLVTASERALALRALELRPGTELEVLVGGLGLGYTAREALTSERVARVDVIEYLPQVIDWMERGLIPLSSELLEDSRFAVTQGDVYGYLAADPGKQYDLILVDVDHSPDERLGSASDSFYTREGLQRAMRHLRPGGLLGVWSYAESPEFESVLRSAVEEVHVETETFVHRFLGDEETNWLYFGRA
jgi:spermidine synthase